MESERAVVDSTAEAIRSAIENIELSDDGCKLRLASVTVNFNEIEDYLNQFYQVQRELVDKLGALELAIITDLLEAEFKDAMSKRMPARTLAYRYARLAIARTAAAYRADSERRAMIERTREAIVPRSKIIT